MDVAYLDYRFHGNLMHSMQAFIQLNIGNNVKVENADVYGATVTDRLGDVWDVVRDHDGSWCKIPAR